LAVISDLENKNGTQFNVLSETTLINADSRP